MTYGFTDFLQLFGSLGLFLFGMKVMSDALMNLAGEGIFRILTNTHCSMNPRNDAGCFNP